MISLFSRKKNAREDGEVTRRHILETAVRLFAEHGYADTTSKMICKEAGVKGIVISHHNGRLDYSLPPLMALPRIREAVGNDMVIFVDCAIESGLDVLKALALGADACSVGRPLMGSLKNGGAEEVAAHLRRIQADLSYAMAMTCCPKAATVT